MWLQGLRAEVLNLQWPDIFSFAKRKINSTDPLRVRWFCLQWGEGGGGTSGSRKALAEAGAAFGVGVGGGAQEATQAGREDPRWLSGGGQGWGERGPGAGGSGRGWDGSWGRGAGEAAGGTNTCCEV